MDEAVRLIAENKDKIDSLVDALMPQNYLKSEEIAQAITRNADTEVFGMTGAE